MSNSTKECPICKLPGVPFVPNENQNLACPRCGNLFVTRSFLIELPELGKADRELLRYLPAFTKQSSEPQTLSHDNWRTFALSHFATRIPEKVDKLLRLLAKRTDIAGENVTVDSNLDYPLIDAASQSEMIYLMEYLIESGFIEGNTGGILVMPLPFRVMVKGWQNLDFPPKGVPGRCFVAMAFDHSLNEAYLLGIKAAIKTDCSLPDPVRIDREEHNEKICDKILAEIRSCQFMVADFTLQAPGVYFEAGFAMGLGRPIIWSCREDDFEKLHFDTRQYNHIKWSSSGDLREKLRDRIRATIPLESRR